MIATAPSGANGIVMEIKNISREYCFADFDVDDTNDELISIYQLQLSSFDGNSDIDGAAEASFKI